MGQSSLKAMLYTLDALYCAMDPYNMPSRFPRDPDDELSAVLDDEDDDEEFDRYWMDDEDEDE